MIVYVFTREHTLDRVKYSAGDEIERTPRMGDWLIAQGVPMRRKVPSPEAARQTAAPVVHAAIPPTAPSSFAVMPRFGCCGPKWK